MAESFCGLRFDQTCDRSMKYHNCGELANHYSTKTVNTIENPKQGNSSLFFLEVSSTLSANQKQNMIMVTMFLTDQDEIKKFYSALYFLVVSSTLSAIQPIKAVMVSKLTTIVVLHGSITGLVKPKTTKLVFVASLSSV
jgi:hypothetical protein